MCKRIAILGGTAFVLMALVLVSAGPVVTSLPEQNSPYLSAIADISAPQASADPPCNYQICVPDVGHPIPFFCDSGEEPTRCTMHQGECSYTTQCNP